MYQQTIARLYRQGQKEKVIVHHIVTKGTRDEDAIKRLKKKEIKEAEDRGQISFDLFKELL